MVGIGLGCWGLGVGLGLGLEGVERAERTVGAAPRERDREQLGGVVAGVGAAEQQHPVRGLVGGAEVAAAVGVGGRGAAQPERMQRAGRVLVAGVPAARVPQREVEVAVGAREQQIVGTLGVGLGSGFGFGFGIGLELGFGLGLG